VERARLEEVGDLHFSASAYSTALDYFSQILDEATLADMPLGDALSLLRKSMDSSLLLGDFAQVDEYLSLADDLLRQAPDGRHDLEASVFKASFQVRKAVVLRESGHLQESLQMSKTAFSILALTDEHADVARLQAGMGIAHYRLGRMEKAEEFYSDSLATFRRIGNDLGVANLLNNLALLHKNRCSWDKARGLMEKALDLATRIGASHLLPGFFLNQAIILMKTDRLGEARPYLDKGLRLAQGLGDRLSLTRLTLAMGRLQTLAGRLASAEEYILEAKGLAEQNRYAREMAIADEYLGDILLNRNEFDKALFNYKLGLQKSRAIAVGNDLEGELLRRVGQAHLAAGNPDEAIAASHAAIAVCEQCGEHYELGFCHDTLGRAYAGQDDVQQLDHHFREAIATFHQQGLTHLWCQAILDFARFRAPGANEAELLLLRRYLMDAQENGASAVSDLMLCRILERLARVQIRLGQFDDALLTVFELERNATSLDDSALDRMVVQLRDRIDAGLLGGMESTEEHLQAIGDLPGLFAGGDSSIPRNLESVLAAGMQRVQAGSGFIAMNSGRPGAGLEIVAREGLTENLGSQLVNWFADDSCAETATGTSFFSRLDARDPLMREVPALASVADSCLFMPISLDGSSFGVLFMGRAKGQLGVGFDRSALDFLATYMGFLALFLREKTHESRVHAGATPIKRIKSFENIITQSDEMLEVLGLARKVAPSDLTVLLNGETGTGKGLLAYSIHALSRRADQKFLSINCAAIPESLLESELFGHVKGAFTGADRDKTGLLAEASGGTVFLDEVGKMPLSMQGKLLHFLDSRVIRPVGSNQSLEVDVRIVAASKSDLQLLSREGRFLEDLYYRLVDFPLVMPPLRERTDDIGLLARHFVLRFSRELGCEVPVLDQAFMDQLESYNWPGNIRELEKALKRAMVLAQGDGVLRPQHLPVALQRVQAGPATNDRVAPLKETLAGIEAREIARALDAAGGNKSEVSRMLKISYPSLLKKIRHYGLS